MDKSSVITIGVILLILVGAAVATYVTQQNVRLSERDTEATRTLSAAEDTPYTDLTGNPFSFDAYRGQVRVVNSWASWTPFSTQELADFEVLAKEYAEKNVAVIAINRKEPKERAQHFLSTIGEFTAVDFAVDLTDAYYQSIGGFSMPETVFYDAKGNIVMHKRGFMSLEEMHTYTEKALNNSSN